MSKLQALKPAMPILLGASLMLSLAMGLRQSLGLFMPELTKDIGISVSDFTLAIAVQNLVWGVLQPVAGALAVRWGFRSLMVGGSALYLLGLMLLATSHGTLGVIVGAGLAIGASMACTGPALAMAAASRPVQRGAAQRGARRRVGRRLAGRAAVGADRPGAEPVATAGAPACGASRSSRW